MELRQSPNLLAGDTALFRLRPARSSILLHSGGRRSGQHDQGEDPTVIASLAALSYCVKQIQYKNIFVS